MNLQYLYNNVSFWYYYLLLVQSVAKSKQEIAEGKCKEYTAAELIAHINS